MANGPTKRVIRLQERLNLRDLGGYTTGDGKTVGWGRLFRSEAIHLMTGQDDTISKRQ